MFTVHFTINKSCAENVVTHDSSVLRSTCFLVCVTPPASHYHMTPPASHYHVTPPASHYHSQMETHEIKISLEDIVTVQRFTNTIFVTGMSLV